MADPANRPITRLKTRTLTDGYGLPNRIRPATRFPARTAPATRTRKAPRKRMRGRRMMNPNSRQRRNEQKIEQTTV